MQNALQYLIECILILQWLNSVATVFGDCPMGYFNSSDNISCCLCPPGYFMRKACDSLTETVCRRCPANTDISIPNNFSLDRCECPSDTYWDSKFLRCTKCTHCARGQRLISSCEKTNDAKCETCRKVSVHPLQSGGGRRVLPYISHIKYGYMPL